MSVFHADVAPMAGVAADLSHINTPTKVSAFTGPEELADALKGCEVVVIPAGVVSCCVSVPQCRAYWVRPLASSNTRIPQRSRASPE